MEHTLPSAGSEKQLRILVTAQRGGARFSALGPSRILPGAKRILGSGKLTAGQSRAVQRRSGAGRVKIRRATFLKYPMPHHQTSYLKYCLVKAEKNEQWVKSQTILRFRASARLQDAETNVT